MNTFKLDKYLFKFADIKYEIYDNESYRGIIFYDGKYQYDIVQNYNLGNRLIIASYLYNEHKDIPLHDGTLYLIPSKIKVEKINE